MFLLLGFFMILTPSDRHRLNELRCSAIELGFYVELADTCFLVVNPRLGTARACDSLGSVYRRLNSIRVSLLKQGDLNA